MAKSPNQARAVSTPKKATCNLGTMKCPPMASGRCTPTSKTVPKLYNKQSSLG